MILADDWFLEQQGMPTHKAVIQTAGKTIMRRAGVGKWWIFTRSRMTRRMAGLILCVPVRLRQLHRHLLGLWCELVVALGIVSGHRSGLPGPESRLLHHLAGFRPLW